MFKIFNSFKNRTKDFKVKQQNLKTQYNAQQPQPISLNYGHIHFNGEKNIKSLGLPLSYDIDYYGMANRAWNLYLTTDITKIVIDRLAQFTVGDGLKLQYEPDKLILKKKYNIDINSAEKTNNLNINQNNFQKYVESIWNIYSNSKYISNNNQSDIHSLSTTVMINTLLCGDCLIIRRIKNGQITLQAIDGRNVCGGAPEHNSNNKVIDGVEINKNGEHIAYHIITETGENLRIKAKDSKGNIQAWLVYANNSRISQVRGVSAICSIIQKIDQLSKYTENEVVASEVNSKLATVIEHTELSDGKNPLVGRELIKNNGNPIYDPELKEETKAAILKLTNGLLINLGVGKTMKSFDTKRPNVNFESFLDANAKYIFASQSIPFEIAIMVFSNNFSASRAALKMFELTLKVLRKNIVVDGIYKPAFKTFFLIENLKGNLIINNFDKIRNNPIDMNALNKCRFISPPIPHVDPLKEVNAVVEKINNNLSTREEGMEELGNSTDFDSTMERISNEIEIMKQLNIQTAEENNNQEQESSQQSSKQNIKDSTKEDKENNKKNSTKNKEERRKT